MRTSLNFMVLLWTLLVAVLPALAETGQYQIEPGKKYNQVKFTSEATIESFDGETQQVTGLITVDPAGLGPDTGAQFSVDLTRLDTGISMRNKHMRDNHLHTDRFPSTSFVCSGLIEGAGTVLAEGSPREISVNGSFDLHGVTQERVLPATVTWYSSGKDTPVGGDSPVIHIVSRFDVKLADHEVPRPQFLFMKVAEAVQLEVDAWAVAR